MRICAGFQILVSGRAYTYDTSWTHDYTIVLKCSFERKGLRQKMFHRWCWRVTKNMVRTLLQKVLMRIQSDSEYGNAFWKLQSYFNNQICKSILLKTLISEIYFLFPWRYLIIISMIVSKVSFSIRYTGSTLFDF